MNTSQHLTAPLSAFALEWLETPAWMLQAWEDDIAQTMTGSAQRLATSTAPQYESALWGAGIQFDDPDEAHILDRPEDWSTPRRWVVYVDGTISDTFETGSTAAAHANAKRKTHAEVYMDRVRLDVLTRKMGTQPDPRPLDVCDDCREQFDLRDLHQHPWYHDGFACSACVVEY